MHTNIVCTINFHIYTFALVNLNEKSNQINVQTFYYMRHLLSSLIVCLWMLLSDSIQVEEKAYLYQQSTKNNHHDITGKFNSIKYSLNAHVQNKPDL